MAERSKAPEKLELATGSHQVGEGSNPSADTFL